MSSVMLPVSTEPTTSARPVAAAARVRPRRRLPVLLIPVLLVPLLAGGLAIAWFAGLRDQYIPHNFGVVEPNRIYRSGQISARLIENTLTVYKIQSIVALSADGMKPADRDAEERAADAADIDRHVYPLAGDGTGSLAVYAAAVAAVDHAVKADKPVLVHCVAGTQRTGGVIALYQLLVEHRPVADVQADLHRYGQENPHLVPFLNAHMAEIADRLVQLHVIDAVPNPMPVLDQSHG